MLVETSPLACFVMVSTAFRQIALIWFVEEVGKRKFMSYPAVFHLHLAFIELRICVAKYGAISDIPY